MALLYARLKNGLFIGGRKVGEKGEGPEVRLTTREVPATSGRFMSGT